LRDILKNIINGAGAQVVECSLCMGEAWVQFPVPQKQTEQSKTNKQKWTEGNACSWIKRLTIIQISLVPNISKLRRAAVKLQDSSLIHMEVDRTPRPKRSSQEEDEDSSHCLTVRLTSSHGNQSCFYWCELCKTAERIRTEARHGIHVVHMVTEGKQR
jgi:hypothetical protein